MTAAERDAIYRVMFCLEHPYSHREKCVLYLRGVEVQVVYKALAYYKAQHNKLEQGKETK